MNHHRLHRILRLITLLRTRRFFNARMLAEELGVTERTVYRDLNILELARVPYHFDKENRGYKISDTFFLPPVSLTLEEALSLLVLAETQGGRRGIPFLLDSLKAFQKIESLLPPEMQSEVGELSPRIDYIPAKQCRHDGFDGVYVSIRTAILKRQALSCTYNSASEKETIRTLLHPYTLLFCRRAWYVIGHSELHGEVRIFKLIRFTAITPSKASYRAEPRFSLARYMGNAWNMIRGDKAYHVKITFSPEVATNVRETLWHRTQRIAARKDGGVIFKADVDGLDEIVWWILGYGEHATVLEPEELKSRVSESLGRMALNYGLSLSG